MYAIRPIFDNFNTLIRSSPTSRCFCLCTCANQAKLFQSVKPLLCEPCKVSFPPDVNPSTLANEFGRFFQQKINSIHESLEVLSVPLPSSTSDDEICIAHAQSSSEPAPSPVLPCELSVFKALSIEEVQKLIARSPIKCCPLDPVPSFVLVQLVHILLPVLTSMINLSFETAHFADA